MRTLCGICGGTIEKRRLHASHKAVAGYDVRYCNRCGSGITSPRPTSEELSSFYSSGNYRSTDGTRFNIPAEFFVRRFTDNKKKRIQRHHQGPGSVLDIGCGRGLFLHLMRLSGWTVTGVEFNTTTASYAASRYGIRVITAAELQDLPPESFDVVTLYHVLEHTDDPSVVVRTSGRVMKKEGLLVVSVPNLSSLQASFGKAGWFHFDLPHHLRHFTLNGPETLLARNSFRIIDVRHFAPEQNIFGWLQTLLNKTGIRRNLLYQLMQKPELRHADLAGAGTFDLVLTAFLLPLYLPLSIALSLVEAVMGRGGTVEVYAVKETS